MDKDLAARPPQHETVGKRTRSAPVEPSPRTVGKQTRVDAEADAAACAAGAGRDERIDGLRCALAAVQTSALPAYAHAVRRADLDPVAHELEILRAAQRVQHMLMVADQQATALTRAPGSPDPEALRLRVALDAVIARAVQAGVYRGAEAIIPGRGATLTLPRAPAAPAPEPGLPAPEPAAPAPEPAAPQLALEPTMGAQPESTPRAAEPTANGTVGTPSSTATAPASHATEPASTVSATEPATSGAAAEPGIAAPRSPFTPEGHLSRQLTLEIERGSVTGAVVATVAMGKTAVGGQLGPVELKTLEQTASVKLDGFVTRLQTSALDAETGFNILDGIRVTFDASVGTFGTSEDGPSFELASVGVKLSGDISHWLALPPGVTVTIDGRLALSLDAVAAAYMAADLEMRILTQELEEVGAGLQAEVDRYRELSSQRDRLAARRGQPGVEARLAKLERELAEQRRALRDGAKQLDGVGQRLEQATHKTRKAFGKLRGGLARQVARVMRSKALATATKVAGRVLPVVNFVVTIVEIAELTGAIYRLAKHGPGDDGGTSAHKTSEPHGDAQNPPGDSGTRDASAGGRAAGEAGASTPSRGKARRAQANDRGGAEPSRATRGPGPITDPSQVDAPAQGPVLHPDGSTAPSPRSRPARDPHARVTGPVTQPAYEPVDLSDPVAVAESLPLSLLRSWFALRDGDLVETGARTTWVRAHARARAATVRAVTAEITRSRARWDLQLRFAIEIAGRVETWSHSFWVTAHAGRLEFVPYMLLGQRASSARPPITPTNERLDHDRATTA